MTPEPFKATPKRNKAGLSGAAVTGIALDDLGSAEVLEIADLNVDADYQRDLRHDLVNSIARDWDIVKAGPILISERDDGTLWVVDGQHRIAGALQAGETQMLAHVVRGLGQQEEAELRLARNDRRSDSVYEKFRTKLVMGDPTAHAIADIVRLHGSQVNRAANMHHGINCISTLEALYSIDGNGVWLGRTLKAIGDAFDGRLDPTTCSVNMIKSVCWFLSQHVDRREVSYNEFVERLGAYGVEDLRRKAVSYKAVHGGSLWVNWYRAMVEVWNFRRSDSNKLEWKTIGSLSTLGDQTSSPERTRRNMETLRQRYGGDNTD